MSLGLYQCGPASIEAVKRGEIGLGFDATFVFTEVNADVYVYTPDKDSAWGYRVTETNTDQYVNFIQYTYSLQTNVMPILTASENCW